MSRRRREAARTLTRAEAEAFYDRIGAKQDTQGFYENVALDELLAHGAFESARAVVEVGCGTGRFAEILLETKLGPRARYVGVDSSATMMALASKRLARFGEHARVSKTDGSLELPFPDGHFDRVVSSYVADLLSPADIEQFLSEAHRVLLPDGRLCVAGLTFGTSPLTRLVSSVWRWVHRLRPALVGGCRPLDMREFVDSDRWTVLHRSIVSGWGVPSEVLVARKKPLE